MKRRNKTLMTFISKQWRTVNKRLVLVVVVLAFAVGAASWLAVTRLNAASFVFPLKVSTNGRYLMDQNGKPFFYAADTGWSMIEFLSVADAKKYIDIRKSQGFSVIQTNVVWDMYRSDGRPRGNPFINDDVTQPNESYWAGVDEIMKYAESQGMVLSCGLLWFSKHGGWESNGPAPSAADFATYATWVGNRYKNQPNLIWMIGGDDELFRNTEVKMAGARALYAADSTHPITYHPRDKEFGLRTENWLAYNSFQWNANVSPWSYMDIREGRELSPAKPVLDAEPPYDPSPCCGGGETTPLKNRWNGWWATLAGAMGVVYGGPKNAWGVGWNGLNWDDITREAPGHTGNIRKIVEQFVWHKLEPDWDNQTVTGGRGSFEGTDYTVAGRSDDGSLIMAYMPSGRGLTVDLSRLSGAGQAQWFDPASGQPSGSAEAVSNSGSQTFNPPGNNSGGDDDWVLVISTPSGRMVDAPPATATPVSTPTATASSTATPLATASPTPVATASPTTSPSTAPTASPTATPIPSVEGDFDRNGTVDLADLTTLLTGWSGTTTGHDLNADSKVDVYDLSILLSHWGT